MHTCGEYTYEDSKLWGKFGMKIFNCFVFRSHSLLSLEYAIWYVPEYNDWAIGSLEDKGTNVRYVTSVNGQGSFNPLTVPEDKWNIWNDIAQSWISVGLGDIKIQCNSKKFLRKLTASQSTQSRPTLLALLEPRGSIFQNGFMTLDYQIKKA